MQLQRTVRPAPAQPLRTLMHMAVANGVDPYRPSHLRELAAHASVDMIRPRRVRDRYIWWEMDRLACDLLKHRREDPENFDAREPLWMRREQLRRRFPCARAVTAR